MDPGGDARKVKTCVSNLTVNALKYTLRGSVSDSNPYSTNWMASALKDTLQSRVLLAIPVVGIHPRSQRPSSENSSRSAPLLTTDQERG